MRQEEQEAESNKRVRVEKFTLELEKKKSELAEKKRVKPKLPDLQISKFHGTHLDWARFLNLFSSQIDKTSITDEAKFPYLRRLVVPKVRITSEKSPADSWGYKQSKEFLDKRCGVTSEVVNAHIPKITSLPIINGALEPKIHSFYDNLLGHVQALFRATSDSVE